MPVLGVITCSTRPGRVGPLFANWFADAAAKHGAFEVEAIDLQEVGLPLFDEAQLPMLREYEHEHTRKWSKTISALDAVTFVTPEYNYSPPPPVLNALTFLSKEWAYMPVAFVGYGLGIAGAARAIQVLRLTTNALRMMPIPESVLFPTYQQIMNEMGELEVPEASEQVTKLVLDELHRWTGALAELRKDAVGR